MITYDYSNACILAKESITIIGAGADALARERDERNKQAIFENYAPFSDCITEIKNRQIYNIKDTDAVIPMYNC